MKGRVEEDLHTKVNRSGSAMKATRTSTAPHAFFFCFFFFDRATSRRGVSLFFPFSLFFFFFAERARGRNARRKPAKRKRASEIQNPIKNFGLRDGTDGVVVMGKRWFSGGCGDSDDGFCCCR